MRIKKSMVWILAAALVGGTALSGCGQQKEEAEESVVEVVELEAAEEQPVEEVEEETILQIGEEGPDSQSVLITNNLDGTITGISVKNPDDEEYPVNMMTTDQSFADGEQAMLYYEPEEEMEETEVITGTIDGMYAGTGETYTDPESDETSGRMTETEAIAWAWLEANAGTVAAAEYENAETDVTGETETETIGPDSQIMTFSEEEISSAEENEIGYFLEVTMADHTVYEFVAFQIDDMDEVSLCLENGVTYLEYTSLATNTPVSTKAVEMIIKNDREAAQNVVAAIQSLPVVTELNVETVTAMAVEAREMYESLSEVQKAYVSNLDRLEEVEEELGISVGETEIEVIEETVVEDTTEVEETVESYDTGGMAGRETEEYYPPEEETVIEDTGDVEWDGEEDEVEVEEPEPEPDPDPVDPQGTE